MNFKGLGYDLKPISLADDEQHDEEFLKINPLGFVPALKLHDRVLIDSYNIMIYLEENRFGYKLIPEDNDEKIKVREIVLLIVCSIQPIQNTGVLKKLDDYEEWPKFWIAKGFKALEAILSKTAGKYCVGDKITMADVCLVPQVFNARKYKVEVEDYPLIVRIDKELENHPCFSSTHPYKQPDYPGNKTN
ncbi:probable maleylacetoacetate isomerase 2 isoform X2 [Onthophagus taurus]|nr:probable maleylacetoacetate isomerase 2 isoform X2 [Onthophagus taurus]